MPNAEFHSARRAPHPACDHAARWPAHWTGGFTLVEVVLGGLVLAIAIAAILGAYVGQLTLNEHARNLSMAINDANRVIEQIRQQNSPCAGAAPSIQWPSDGSWNGWLGNLAAGGGKSIQPDPNNNEFVATTCQEADGSPTYPSCSAADTAGANPVRVTVAVCWRHRGRIIGECDDTTPPTPNEGRVVANDTAAIDSPAMLTTLVTCR